MVLKDIIDSIVNDNLITPPFDVEYRITLPDEFQESDTLYGYCRWTGEELMALDQDDYSLNDEILSYEVFEVSDEMAEFPGEKALCVVIEGQFLSSDNTWKNCSPEDESSEKDKSRAQRRHNDYKKAIRKRNITRKVYRTHGGDWEYYDNLHQYSKNKIHCSCPMCSSKTNAKKSKGNGRRVAYGPRWGSTAHREGDNLTRADKRKFDAMSEKAKNYKNGEEYNDEDSFTQAQDYEICSRRI